MEPVPPLILPRHDVVEVPIGGRAVGVIVALTSTSILAVFITRRAQVIQHWRKLPFVAWIVFAIYFDSYAFVVVSALLLQAFGVNSTIAICDSTILLCLVCYVFTKILIYLFLVEKAHIVRCTPKRRLESKLYIVNLFGMLSLFGIIGVLNFIFRTTKMENGVCVIGMRSISMIPLISFDALVNIYLTLLFLVPLKKLYTNRYMPRSTTNTRLRRVALRTFIGALCTLTSSVLNLTMLMALNGEPGWVCLICCNADILFSAIVIQWVTSKDNVASASALNTPIDLENPRRPPLRPLVPTTNFTDPELALIMTIPESRGETHDSREIDCITTMDTNRSDELLKPTAAVVVDPIRRASDASSATKASSLSPPHNERENTAVLGLSYPRSNTTGTLTELGHLATSPTRAHFASSGEEAMAHQLRNVSRDS